MTTRTPQDYAIEHAEYLAKGAEALLDALNTLACANEAMEVDDDDPTLTERASHAEEAMTDHMGNVRNLVYGKLPRLRSW